MVLPTQLDLDKICRVCLRAEQDMLLIFDEQQCAEFTMSIAGMLTELTMYKVERFDELPHLICGACKAAVRSAYCLKRECEQSYRKLMALLDNSNSNSLARSDEILIKTEAKDQTEKCTQTEDSTLYPCERCEQKFFTFDALKAHRENEHKGSAITCRFCCRTFNRVGYLRTHIAVFHPGTGYTSHNQCHICQRQFTRREHMRRHLAVIHKMIEIIGDTAAEEEMSAAQETNEMTQIEATTKQLQILNDLDQPTEEFISLNNESSKDSLLNINKSMESIPEPEEFHGNDSKAFIECSDLNLGSDDEDEDEDEKPLSNLLKGRPIQNFSETLGIFSDSLNDDKLHLGIDGNDAANSQRIRKKRGRGRPSRNLNKSTTSQSCELCGKSFEESDALQHHVQKEHFQKQDFSCRFCGKRFASEAEHKSHINSEHDSGKMMPFGECDKVSTQRQKDKTHKCLQCQKSFTTKVYLQRHAVIHDRKRYVCKECSESFLTRDELTAHTKAEGHDKPLLCPECGLRCKTSNILMVHMRRHNGEKPFKCRFCSKGFPRMDDLRVHEKYHTGEKSHFCETCGKGFQRKYNLTIHLRVHTGEKPYKCPHCPQAFAQGNDLKAHIRRHTGERFRCEVCGAAFLQGYQIRQHKLTEHGIREDPPTQRVAKFTSPKEQEEQIKQNLQKELSKVISLKEDISLLK